MRYVVMLMIVSAISMACARRSETRVQRGMVGPPAPGQVVAEEEVLLQPDKPESLPRYVERMVIPACLLILALAVIVALESYLVRLAELQVELDVQLAEIEMRRAEIEAWRERGPDNSCIRSA